eukprot:1150773-Pelagomonas_calceolata.AAC.9
MQQRAQPLQAVLGPKVLVQEVGGVLEAGAHIKPQILLLGLQHLRRAGPDEPARMHNCVHLSWAAYIHAAQLGMCVPRTSCTYPGWLLNPAPASNPPWQSSTALPVGNSRIPPHLWDAMAQRVGGIRLGGTWSLRNDCKVSMMRLLPSSCTRAVTCGSSKSARAREQVNMHLERAEGKHGSSSSNGAGEPYGEEPGEDAEARMLLESELGRVYYRRRTPREGPIDDACLALRSG